MFMGMGQREHLSSLKEFAYLKLSRYQLVETSKLFTR